MLNINVTADNMRALSEREYDQKYEFDCILASIYREAMYNESYEYFIYQKAKVKVDEEYIDEGFSFEYLSEIKTKLENLGFTVTLETCDHRNTDWELKVRW